MRKTKILVAVPTAIFYVGTVVTTFLALQSPVNWEAALAGAAILLVATIIGKPWRCFGKDPIHDIVRWLNYILVMACIALVTSGLLGFHDKGVTSISDLVSLATGVLVIVALWKLGPK